MSNVIRAELVCHTLQSNITKLIVEHDIALDSGDERAICESGLWLHKLKDHLEIVTRGLNSLASIIHDYGTELVHCQCELCYFMSAIETHAEEHEIGCMRGIPCTEDCDRCKMDKHQCDEFKPMNEGDKD